ncbi:MAG TPA: HAD family hydrolase [Stenotrophomonas sp.]|nr:HAD family hydrolase [Stenotrophomonas sp.]
MTGALPSWNDGDRRKEILEFVASVTRDGGAGYVPPAERIAVFDNDGTLWAEYPLYVQIYFTLSEVERLAALEPALRDKPAFKALLEHDLKALQALSKREVFEPAFAVHAGMNIEQFRAAASAWLAEARHPKFGRLFTACIYQPQLELMDYLREHGFKVFIVTGGGIEFVRTVAERLYGVPPEQVIGSSTRGRLELTPDTAVIRKLAEVGSFDDRDEKAVNIALHIGRRPIFAFGNSDGDLAMLRYTLAGEGERLALLLHHDDGERESAYDRQFLVSPLNEGLDRAAEYGISQVSMKRDWGRVFA